MNPDYKTLALRDPALATLIGGVSGADFGADFGDDYNGEAFGSEFGVGETSIPTPTPAEAMKLWREHHQRSSHTNRREMVLEPNKGSSAKIERYAFQLSQALTIGTPAALNLTGQPSVKVRPQRLSINAPCAMFAFLSGIQISNVNVHIGNGVEDAFDYNANGVGQVLDMPTIDPAQRATIIGNYSGLTPPGFPLGLATNLTATFKGPAQMTA